MTPARDRLREAMERTYCGGSYCLVKQDDLAEVLGDTEWKCCARLHFGDSEDSAPACQIKAGAEGSLLKALRDAEREASDARQAIASECTDSARAHYSQMSRHSQALIAAEEAGYEKGLEDGRALAASPPTDREAAGNALDYRAEFEAAMLARDEAGCVGMSPAETISRLSAELDAALHQKAPK